MIIDTHTHVYPEKIARKIMEMTLKSLAEHEPPPYYGDLTVPGLLEAMDRAGVQRSITFCIAERAEIVRAANDFLLKECDRQRLVPFGTIPPDLEDYQGELNRLRQNGVKGVKFSSLFQPFRLDEDRMMRVYEALGDNMIAYFHMGRGSGKYAEHSNSTPEMLARVLDTFPKLRVVAAHFGGLGMLDEARKHLFGRDLYLDTVWIMGDLDPNLVARIVHEHGSKKIVFGTDYPFGDMAKGVQFIRSLPLGEEDRERILWRNAQELLKIAT